MIQILPETARRDGRKEIRVGRADDPGVGGFTIGTPMFSHVTLHLGDEMVLVISSKGEGVYMRGVRVNGKPHASSWLKLSDLSAPKNTIEFELQSEPDHAWAAKEAEYPPSFDVK